MIAHVGPHTVYEPRLRAYQNNGRVTSWNENGNLLTDKWTEACCWADSLNASQTASVLGGDASAIRLALEYYTPVI